WRARTRSCCAPCTPIRPCRRPWRKRPTQPTARRSISDRIQGTDMANTGRNWGPLHPPVEKTERLAKTSLPRERQLELYHFMKLNRMVEDRLGNLYRQGKGGGGVYGSRGPGG